VAAAIRTAKKKGNSHRKTRPPQRPDHLPVYFVKGCLTSPILHAACAPDDSEPHQSTTYAPAVERFTCITILPAIKATWTREALRSARPDLWRYLPVLPPQRAESIVSLVKGLTPLIRARRLGAATGAQNLWVKDEGLNPTASFQGSRHDHRDHHGEGTRHSQRSRSRPPKCRQCRGRLCRCSGN